MAKAKEKASTEEIVEEATQDGTEMVPPPDADLFEGEIKVASRIVDFLSSGLYETPAACLKELVNNSYDADATKVHVLVKPDADRIIISDNGIGFTRDEFLEHFERVSESHKRDEGDKTNAGRPKIGRIGIGLIAANELCHQMVINSTRRGEPEQMWVSIDFEAMREDLNENIEERRDKKDATTIKKGDFDGWTEPVERNKHYTRIYLKRVRGASRLIFSGASREAVTSGEQSLYGKKPETIVKVLGEGIRSWSDFDEYSQTMLAVGLNVPVRYGPEWLPTPIRRRLHEFDTALEELDFTVVYDGTDLRKPTVLGKNDRSHLLERFNFEGEHVSAKGYFFVQHTTLHPENLNGVLIRIRNAAVGEYDRGWMDFVSSENPLFQRWVSAEIWADDRLERALNIDRRTLRITHPAYVELQAAVHKKFSEVLKKARIELYQKRSEGRRATEAREEADKVVDLARMEGVRLSAESQRAIGELRSAVPNRATVRRTLAKRSVAEVYRITLEVAEEVLSPADYKRFAKALANRLLR